LTIVTRYSDEVLTWRSSCGCAAIRPDGGAAAGAADVAEGGDGDEGKAFTFIELFAGIGGFRLG
jgi:hypothetical protein